MAAKFQKELRQAAAAVKRAKALIFTSGAGMGVDSGLPDFRGPEGFWRAYPPLRERGLHLESTSTPHWFDTDPKFAWGFFGHRYNLYKHTKPHKGYDIILNWGKKMDHGYFAFTSNVDGQLQKAGFDEDRVAECHGTIHYMQCVDTSFDSTIWPVPEGTKFDVGDDLCLRGDIPCGPPGQNHPARPNILMFGDWSWLGDRTDTQMERYCQFRADNLQKGVPFVVIEIGAGLTVPTVRCESEQLVGSRRGDGILIRINPSEPFVPSGHIGLAMGALDALQQIAAIHDSL